MDAQAHVASITDAHVTYDAAEVGKGAPADTSQESDGECWLGP